MDQKTYIQMKDIVKVYPPDKIALNKVSVEIDAGEIHSIIGENGAGKSTLMKVLFGLEKANEGGIFMEGDKVNISTPQEAVKMGIGMVHQEFMLISEYTVIENIVLGDEPVKKGLLNLNASRVKLEKIMQDFKFDIPLDAKIKDISIAAQQKVEIVKLLFRDVNTLILDEPTAVLAPQETDELFVLLRRIKSQGKTIIFISHKLNEVLEISDRITVMRQGQHIWTKDNENLTKADLANAMVGRSVMMTVDKKPAVPGEVILKADNLTMQNVNVSHKKDLDQVSFEIHSGEILGVAGVEGNGQYELVQAIMGLASAEGSIYIDSQDISGLSVKERRKLIAYVPQDRKRSGSSQEESILMNAIMTHHYVNDAISNKWGILKGKQCREMANRVIEGYQVSCQGADMNIGSLSGGNQQKVIVGREFELDSRILVVDQPVRGLDVGSIEYIHRRIVEKRDNGEAVLLASADLDELFNLSDRIIVMYNGKVVMEKNIEDTTKEEVGAYMLGAGGEKGED